MPPGIIADMIEVFIALAGGLLLGAVLGWLAKSAHAAAPLAAARAEADAIRDSHGLAARSLSTASEDAARRQSSAIGAQLTHVVDPLRAVLGQLSDELRRVEHQRAGAYAGLSEQVRGMHALSMRLNDQTRALTNALHTPHIRGRWGEMQLERVVEVAGLSRHCDFDTQVSGTSADGEVRPDLVVRLAGGRNLVVDAKAPLHAYLEAASCDDPDRQRELLAEHARALRSHITTLSGKAYWSAFDNTPEMVVMFVPGDAVLEAAARADPTLIDFGFGRNVVLATPSSLVALLRTVALGWRHDAMAQDAAVIHRLGIELHHRLESVLGHLDRVGGSLRRAVESYNTAVGAIDTRLGVTARKLAELEALGDLDEPHTPDVIDDTARRAVRFTDDVNGASDRRDPAASHDRASTSPGG
ncbi:DNA recombination protein RmuC [Gordonia sinesedis]